VFTGRVLSPWLARQLSASLGARRSPRARPEPWVGSPPGRIAQLATPSLMVAWGRAAHAWSKDDRAPSDKKAMPSAWERNGLLERVRAQINSYELPHEPRITNYVVTRMSSCPLSAVFCLARPEPCPSAAGTASSLLCAMCAVFCALRRCISRARPFWQLPTREPSFAEPRFFRVCSLLLLSSVVSAGQRDSTFDAVGMQGS
jgi:hypothetical protein